MLPTSIQQFQNLIPRPYRKKTKDKTSSQPSEERVSSYKSSLTNSDIEGPEDTDSSYANWTPKSKPKRSEEKENQWVLENLLAIEYLGVMIV